MAKVKDKILKERSTKLGFMTAFAHASASVLALKEIPAANTSIEGDSIVYLDYLQMREFTGYNPSFRISTSNAFTSKGHRRCLTSGNL